MDEQQADKAYETPEAIWTHEEPPEELIKHPSSYTGHYLKPLLT